MVNKHSLMVGLVACAFAIGAQAADKPAAASKSAKKSSANKAAPAPHQPMIAPEPQALTAEQLAIAERVHVGQIPCELSAHVNLQPHPTAAGYFVLDIARQRFVLSPVATTTGAVRLEDAHAGAVWLQLANKSMLMNQKLGQRMADECMSPGQQQVAQALARTQTTGGGLLDAPKPAPTPLVLAQPAPGVAATATE